MNLNHTFLLSLSFSTTIFSGIEPPANIKSSKIVPVTTSIDPLQQDLQPSSKIKPTAPPKRVTILAKSSDNMPEQLMSEEPSNAMVMKIKSDFLSNDSDSFNKQKPLPVRVFANKDMLFTDIAKIVKNDPQLAPSAAENCMNFLHNELGGRRSDLFNLPSEQLPQPPLYLAQSLPSQDFVKINGLQSCYNRLYQYSVASGIGLRQEDFTLMMSMQKEALSGLDDHDLLLKGDEVQETQIEQFLSAWGEKVGAKMRMQCIDAIQRDDMDKVKSLINIDNCLRAQDGIDYIRYGRSWQPLFLTDFKEEDGKTALHLAVEQNNVEMVTFFVQDNRDFIIKTPDEKNAVHCYCANAMRKSAQGYTPLDCAYLSRAILKNSSPRTVLRTASTDSTSDSDAEFALPHLQSNRKIINTLVNVAGVPLRSDKLEVQQLIVQDQTRTQQSTSEKQSMFKRASRTLSQLFTSPNNSPRGSVVSAKVVPV